MGLIVFGGVFMEILVDKYFEMFKGLPNNNPIVRNSFREDAYVVAVLDLMYKKLVDLKINIDELENISKMIVAPPDGGIDIFIEHDDGDENYYDIIQVKNSELAPQEIKGCFREMKGVLEEFKNNANDVPKNLREVLAETGFDSSVKLDGDKCKFYVIHNGSSKDVKGLGGNQIVLTFDDLKILSESQIKECVPQDVLKIDEYKNFSAYEHENLTYEDKAYICNINGYDLAMLNNKYVNTQIGRNILFGQNLRESLGKKSKTYKSMENTINLTPEKFWFYNNGITIIAESYKQQENEGQGSDAIKLTNFSIINGAQTTSSLGLYLKDAILGKEEENEVKIRNLKKVFVLARILVIKDTELRKNIAIYNNTQNTITSRDMVSNSKEQKELHSWLIGGQKPHIYVEISRGRKEPASLQLRKHQRTTNELLAQYVFAAFEREPYTAKDKKSTLFNNDHSSDFTINKDYHRAFYYDEEDFEKCGIIFKKTKEEIDELLFIVELYKEARKHLKQHYNEMLDKQKDFLKKVELEYEEDDVEENKKDILEMIDNINKHLSINNICLFYFLTLYYEVKLQFNSRNSVLKYDYTEYYAKKSIYKKDLIGECTRVFLEETIDIIAESSNNNHNMGSWIRTKKAQDVFLKELRKRCLKSDYKIKFVEFYNKYS